MKKRIISFVLVISVLLMMFLPVQANAVEEIKHEYEPDVPYIHVNGLMTSDIYANPHNALWLDQDITDSIETLSRLDDKGFLYSMTYSGNYYSEKIQGVAGKIAEDFGCSAFITENMDGDILICRNYDYRHNDKNGDMTALNVVLRINMQGVYKSVNLVDAFWLDGARGGYCGGCLDDGKTDISSAAVFPFLCMDGMNECGLTASLLKLDIKNGEECTNQKDPGKKTVIFNVLLRLILDKCQNIDEAVVLARSFNVASAGGFDVHIFVAEKSGRSVVLEWCYNKLNVVKTNAVTYFYTAFDDAADYYRGTRLHERFSALTNTLKPYRYGFGHGFHRFNSIVSSIERYCDYENPSLISKMPDEQALNIMKTASQYAHNENACVSLFSVIYNQTELRAEVYNCLGFEKPDTFSVI